MEAALSRLERAAAKPHPAAPQSAGESEQFKALQVGNAALRDTALSVAKTMDKTIGRMKTLLED